MGRIYVGTKLGRKVYVGMSHGVSDKSKKELTPTETFASSFIKSFLISLAAIFTIFSLVKPKRRRRRW